ncbi:MAG: hypothetical protein AB7I18_08395 [Candidatus Berkiella sp.]
MTTSTSIDLALDALKKWYTDHTKPIPKKEAHDFIEIKKELAKISSKKLSNEAKTKEMFSYLEEHKHKGASRIAGFILLSLTRQGITATPSPQPTQTTSVVPTPLLQLKQMLITSLPSGPNVVEKSLEGNHVRVHFPSGKLESTYRYAALKDALAFLKISFTEEKSHGSIPVLVLDEASIQSVSDWQTTQEVFKTKFQQFVAKHMNSAIDHFQSKELARGNEHKEHRDILEMAISKIKEHELKSPISGIALEQRNHAIKHILTGIDYIKNKRLNDSENRVALDRLLSSAGHNVQNTDAVKIMQKVQEDLHIKGAAKPGRK